MSGRPTIVASDAHLGATPDASRTEFLSFLEEIPRLTDDLVLNGDLFDFWFEYPNVVIRKHFPVLRRLADLTDRGVRIRLVEGNHDGWTGSFLRDEVGLELIREPVVTTLGGRRTYLAHGDGLAGGDLGYRVFKKLTRNRISRRLFRLVPPDVSLPLVRRLSRTSHREERPGPGDLKRAAALSGYADTLLEEDPDLELVVFGHSHVPELREVGRGRHYLNPGDWIHHFTYGVVSPEGVELKEW